MSGKWFSNRGQMAQLGVALLALLLGISIAWPKLSPHMNLLALWPLFVVPLASYFVFEAGRRFGVPNLSPVVEPKSPLDWFNEDIFRTEVEIFTPSIKVGAFWEIGTTRVTVAALQSFKLPNADEQSGVQLTIKSNDGQFAGGSETKRLGYNEFIVPLSSTAVASESKSVFCFGALKGSIVYFTMIRVDHINIPGQEVSLSICILSSTNSKRLHSQPMLS